MPAPRSVRRRGIRGVRRWVFPSSPPAQAEILPPARWLLRAGEHLLALLFPDNCRLCGRPLEAFSSVPVCSDCLQPPPPFLAEFFCLRCRTPFLNARPLNADGLCRLCAAGVTAFDGAWACGAYDGRLRDLIHLFKYRRMIPLARPFGRMMARAFPRDQRFDYLVPVPAHWRRRLSRGFDQSLLLSRQLSRHTGIPVLCALRRSRHTAPQAGLTRRQRRDNIRGCFETKDPVTVRGARLLLIDDVLTTGATANAAADALRRSGAAWVGVFTLARADRRSGLIRFPDSSREVSEHERQH